MTAPDEIPNSDNRKSIAESPDSFMIKEYERLLILRQDYIRLGDNRFNFFLLILSAVVVFMTWLNSAQTAAYLSKNTAGFLTVTIVFGTLALGLTTFFRIIRRNIKISKYEYDMRRIQLYFAQKFPDTAPYLGNMPVKDDAPKYQTINLRDIHRNFTDLFSQQLPIMLAIINGLIASAGLSVILLQSSFQFTIVLFFSLLILFVWGQISIFNSQMDQAKKDWKKKNAKIST
jgi:hypothetical protein